MQKCAALFNLHGLNKCLQEDIHRPLIQLYYDNVMRVQHVTRWRREFENGRMTIRDDDDDDDGRYSASRTDEDAAGVEGLVLENGGVID